MFLSSAGESLDSDPTLHDVIYEISAVLLICFNAYRQKPENVTLSRACDN